MTEPAHDPHAPTNHSPKPNRPLVITIGILGGSALFIGILVWYVVYVVNSPAPPLPNTPAGSGNKTSSLTLDTPVLVIEPLAEMHVKIVNGLAESIEPCKEPGVSAKLDGQNITVTTAAEVKEGSYQIKVHGTKEQETTLTVTVKKRKT